MRAIIISFVPVMLLVSCSGLVPDVSRIVDDMTDTAVRVDLAKEIVELNDTDIEVTVKVTSKDHPQVR